MWLSSQNRDIFINLSQISCIYKNKVAMYEQDMSVKEEKYYIKVSKTLVDRREDITIAKYTEEQKIDKVIKDIFDFMECNNNGVFKIPKDSEVKINE